MQVSLHHQWDSIDAEAWDALCLRSVTNTVFQSWAWHSAWFKEFGDQSRLYLVSVKENGQLIGLAPLCIILKGPLRILKFIGTGHSDYSDFIYSKDKAQVVGEIFKFLKTRGTDWDAMALDYIPESSPTVRSLPIVCKEAGLCPSLYSELPCPVFLIDRDKGNLKELINKKKLKQDHHSFQDKGEYEVLHLKSNEAIMSYLDLFFSQHKERCKAVGRQSLFERDCNQQFYKNLVMDLCPRQWLNFTILRSAGKTIAFHFGFTYNRSFICYKPSFDGRFSKYSPGQVLLRELFLFCADKEFDVFDFTTGDEEYKQRFTNAQRKNCSFKVFKSRRDCLADGVLGAMRGLFKK